MMLYALVAVCALSGVLCDESTKKNCSRTQEHFNFSKLVGRWHLAQVQLEHSYIIDNYPDVKQQPYCLMVDIQLDKDKSKKLIHSIRLERSNGQERWNLTGPMVVSDDSTNPAKLYLNFNFFRIGNITTIPLYIAETDYQTYVIISYCHAEIYGGPRIYEGSVILVKNLGLVEDSQLRASRVAEEHRISYKYDRVYEAPAKCALI